MRKILILMVAVGLIIGMGGIGKGAFAGGSIFANKIIGGTGTTYDVNLNQKIRNLTVFGDGDFHSDIDNSTSIKTDEISAGLMSQLTEEVTTIFEYSEDYRGGKTVKEIEALGIYTLANGLSFKLDTEWETDLSLKQATAGIGFLW